MTAAMTRIAMHDRPADSTSAGELSTGIGLESSAAAPSTVVGCASIDGVSCVHASAGSRLGRPRETPDMGHAGHDRQVRADGEEPQRRNDISRKQANGEDQHALRSRQETYRGPEPAASARARA